LPSRVGRDPCSIADRWDLDLTLADRLVRLDSAMEAAFEDTFGWPGLFIISGQRSAALNRAVGGAADSRHLACPSLAVDLRVGTVEGIESPEIWAILGGQWRIMGGRWGGTFREPDLNHFDLG